VRRAAGGQFEDPTAPGLTRPEIPPRSARPVHRFIPDPSAPTPDDAVLAQTRVVKNWVRAFLGIDDNTAVTLHEVACVDPGCPLVETSIVVFEPARTRRWKLTRPKAAITKLMVHQTLATPPLA